MASTENIFTASNFRTDFTLIKKIEVLSGEISLYPLYSKIYSKEGEKLVSGNFPLTPEEESIIE